ncbi:hypothetical protein SAMN00017405_2097 [Desulfonispora thiosulfatigenes DSM 11270]|uniref:Uncharacterized protein n=1 Tax=Desulfonispora thiosulfatigenes DSM 11270 TaxID=656914 RepID=A0A1W1VI98_DESTI|nr:hypothetical protein [Desulfonispora thiosulfatigenes]SMB92771.1 hypothetical protein SAMN00017405_2097 [Desulfonispora thiosulfatigenes DSM 11270]
MKFLFFILILVISYYIWRYYNRNWIQLLTTQDVDKYMKIVGLLQNSHLKYKTTSGGEEFNFHKGAIDSKTPPISYTIWVDKANLYNAEQIINQK